MNIKSLLLGSTAALIAVSGARAADVVVAEPEPVEYLRVCDAYGDGYFYIPGTETCMRISGYLRADIKGGDNVYARKRDDIDRDTYAWRTRATLRFHTASETELGTLRTFIELRSQWDEGAEWNGKGDSASGQLRFAFIELGGVRVGLDESIFNHWTGYFGNVINDDIVNPMAYTRTNMISYTFNAGNGFSAILGLEQGNDDADDFGVRGHFIGDTPDFKTKELSGKIDDYTPNVVGGLKYVQGWGGISVVGAYDAYYEEWAAKARLDLNVTDQWSVWVMGGYKSADDYYNYDETYGDRFYTDSNGKRYGYKVSGNLTKVGIYRQVNSIYGDWGGDWIVWGGTTFKFNKKASFNAQLSYDDTDVFAASVNVKYELVPGLVITPELTYISWDNDYSARNQSNTVQFVDSLKSQDAFQGMVRIQRSF